MVVWGGAASLTGSMTMAMKYGLHRRMGHNNNGHNNDAFFYYHYFPIKVTMAIIDIKNWHYNDES